MGAGRHAQFRNLHKLADKLSQAVNLGLNKHKNKFYICTKISIFFLIFIFFKKIFVHMNVYIIVKTSYSVKKLHFNNFFSKNVKICTNIENDVQMFSLYVCLLNPRID